MTQSVLRFDFLPGGSGSHVVNCSTNDFTPSPLEREGRRMRLRPVSYPSNSVDMDATPKSASHLLFPVKCSRSRHPRLARNSLRGSDWVTIMFMAFFSIRHSFIRYLTVNSMILLKISSGFRRPAVQTSTTHRTPVERSTARTTAAELPVIAGSKPPTI